MGEEVGTAGIIVHTLLANQVRTALHQQYLLFVKTNLCVWMKWTMCTLLSEVISSICFMWKHLLPSKCFDEFRQTFEIKYVVFERNHWDVWVTGKWEKFRS